MDTNRVNRYEAQFDHETEYISKSCGISNERFDVLKKILVDITVRKEIRRPSMVIQAIWESATTDVEKVVMAFIFGEITGKMGAISRALGVDSSEEEE